MTDLSTLLDCITILIVSFSILRFGRWAVKCALSYDEELERFKKENEKLKAENAELKRKAVNNDERLSDIY